MFQSCSVRSSIFVSIIVAWGVFVSNSRAQSCFAPDFCRQIEDFRQIPEVDGDNFGFATAISGDTVAVSDLPQGWELTGVGSVRVYREVSGNWILEQTITAPGGTETGFGYALALKDDLLVVSAPTAQSQGRAFVFRRSGTAWSFESELVPPSPPQPRRFGSSIAIAGIAIAGDRIIIGSLNYGAPFGQTNGAVYIFHFDGSTWNFEIRLIAPAPAIEDGFGGEVDVDGEWMVVAARNARCPGGDGCGAIYFFRLSGDTWTYHSSIYGSEHSNPIGDSVGLDGTIAAYGMPFDNDPTARVGSIHILQFNGTNWVEEVRIPHPSPMADARFGWQIGVQEDLVLAASNFGSTCYSGGSIYAFRRNQGQWPLAGTLGENGGADFYGRLALDEGRAIMGSYDQACQGGPGRCGAAFLFSAGASGSDCDCDGIADGCACSFSDCNENNTADSCDIESGFSQDANGDGRPDECPVLIPQEVTVDPSGINKSRFISFVVPNQEVGLTSLRVLMVSLHHVAPPYNAGPSIPFTIFEGKSVWVGPPANYIESTSTNVPFKAAWTQCTPHYQDWSNVGLLHVTGAHIVPSSIYHVQQLSIGCQGQETNCDGISPPLEIRTTRWADVADPFNPPSLTTQPNLSDATSLVSKFRSALGAIIKARAFLVANTVFGEITTDTLSNDMGFTHIAAVVDAYRGGGYPYQMGKCAVSLPPPSTNACTTDADCGANGPCNLYCP
jgi:hypothetical protein